MHEANAYCWVTLTFLMLGIMLAIVLVIVLATLCNCAER
jgi:hypothetical protein